MTTDQSFDFQASYADSVPALSAWAAIRLRGPLQAEFATADLVQEVACRAYARRDRFDPERGEFRAWLFGIARNVLLRALEDLASGRRHIQGDWLSTQNLHRLPAEATSITQAVVRGEQLSLFMDRVGGLEEEERRLLLLRGLEGLPHAEVAEQLALDEATCARRWQRLRLRLRDDWSGLMLED